MSALLPALAIVCVGVALVVAGALRAVRRPPLLASATTSVGRRTTPIDVGPGGAELPEGVDLDAVRVWVTRSYAYVYLTGAGPCVLNGERARLVAIWRWSRVWRRLVADDRRWAPAWSRPIAERGWAAR